MPCINNTYYYNYGIPGYVIWIFHILFGISLIYLGYSILHKETISENIGIIIIVIGSLASLYHVHLYQNEDNCH